MMRTRLYTFTLTPALSLRERENRSPAHVMSCDCEKHGDLTANESRRLLFPLPAGEGQGEGELPDQKATLECL